MGLLNADLALALALLGRGLLPVQTLREWLAENVWELSQSPSPLDRMLLGEMELALAEYDRQDRDEQYIRDLARGLLMLVNPQLLPQEVEQLEAIAA
ncbi:MAG: hypothetical protein HYY00_06945 [Chloroflexi bacterium]|nr:hypothetical protein [Chloroflexota bacterium]